MRPTIESLNKCYSDIAIMVKQLHIKYKDDQFNKKYIKQLKSYKNELDNISNAIIDYREKN